MLAINLIVANALRHKLRSILTVLGMVVATLSFGLLQTVIDAWYAGVNAASNTRLVTRNAISLIFPMPLFYKDKIRRISGVEAVAYANWFGGIYQEPKNFFPQFAISGASFLDMYPEFLLSEEQRSNFLHDRKGCIVGRKLATRYGFKIGDVIPLKGTIFPGQWEFVVRGIYDGKHATTDTSQMLFQWDYFNESLRRLWGQHTDQVGWYAVQIANPDDAARISNELDASFKNSLAETLTETEKAFQLGFVSMSEAIVTAIRVVSFVVIVIIMAVMANTMAMSTRERMAEYATLKALGFGPGFLTTLIFGESLLLSLFGALLGMALLFPVAREFSARLGAFFPTFEITGLTLLLQIASAVVVGMVAAIGPSLSAGRLKIVDGLRSVA